MKKLINLLLIFAAGTNLFAGGLVTNTNQSSMFTRFQCRDATIDIDAAFYNPAGLVHMSNGFYLSVNNQTIGQVQLITNEYENFGDEPKEFRGKVLAPLFPGLFGVYKTGRFAFSAGVVTIGGDGAADFEDGLPSYERELADAVPVMSNSIRPVDQTIAGTTGTDPLYSNITGYSFDMDMSSYSMSTGYQLNAAYAINDYLSIAAGVRFVSSKGSITAEATNLMLDVTTNSTTLRMSPSDYLRTITTDADTISAINTAILNAKADAMEAMETMEAEITQSGYGFTPIISFNYSRSLNTNWSFKYEFRTNIDLETTVVNGKDANNRFIDRSIVSADLPAMLSIGVTRRPYNKLLIYSGIHYYFDKPILNNGESRITLDLIDNNTYEFAVGAEYKLNDEIRASAGWLISRPGVNSEFQSEKRFVLPSNTLGAGLGIRISRLIDLNLGGSYTLYKKDSKDITYTPEDSVTEVSVTEYYDIRKWVFSVGVDFLFGENN
jgi:long-chain fatty acid transport protein